MNLRAVQIVPSVETVSAVERQTEGDTILPRA